MRLRHGFIAGIILMVPGCASQDVIVQKQTEMESRLEYVIQSNKSLTMQVAGLSSELKELKDRIQNDSAALKEWKESAGGSGSEAKEVATKERPSLQRPSVTKIELINSEMMAGEKNDSASESYMKAFGLYSADNYTAAVVAFNSFLEKHPDTEYAVNAQYWLGECYYSRSDLPKALEAFRKVVEKYPKGKKVPDALLKIGYTLFAMKEPAQAKAVLLSLVGKFPDSPAAAKAKERLEKK